jgi:putative hydrolase of the HAD superfamily
MEQREQLNRHWIPQPQAVQAVFFDVGFTLLDTYPSIPAVVHTSLQRSGLTVDIACLERSLPAAETLFTQMTREDPLTWSDEIAIRSIWQRYFVELLRPCLQESDNKLLEAAAEVQREFDKATSYAPYPDVQPTLRALHERGLKLGVISDWGIALSIILRHFELTQYFDFTVISATARRAKPDPALYQLALERADVTADYALHVGDSYVRDVLGARAVGMTGILIDRAGMLQPGVVDCPLVYDLFELLDLLELARPNTQA